MKIIATLTHVNDSRRVPWQETYLVPIVDNLADGYQYAKDLIERFNAQVSDASKLRQLEIVELRNFHTDDAMALGMDAAKAGVPAEDCPFLGGGMRHYWMSAYTMTADSIAQMSKQKAPLLPGALLVGVLLLILVLLPGCQLAHNAHVSAEQGTHSFAAWMGQLSTVQWLALVVASVVGGMSAIFAVILWAAWKLEEVMRREMDAEARAQEARI